MDRSKQALSLYEDRVQKALYTQVPTLTDEQHSKVAQLIIDLLTDKGQADPVLKEANVEVLHLVTVPNKALGGMTAFFQKYPHCITEGYDLPEVLHGLADCMAMMLEDQRTGKHNPVSDPF
jgi:hypothetical protein